MNLFSLPVLTQRLLITALVILATGLLTTLSGCATREGGAQAEMMTESDQTDERRRARLRLELALAYFQQGQTSVALDEIKQAIATDPTWSEAYNLRGLVYMQLKELRLAEDGFQRALQLKPNDANYLHNYGWLSCQQKRYTESIQFFNRALANPAYSDRAKSWMTKGVCELAAGLTTDAQSSLMHAYELDAGNPITAYNLALLLYQRGEFAQAQSYIRRLNNTELANAESLWLGIRVERKMNNREALGQLAIQLKKRFPESAQADAFSRGAFDE